MNGFMFQYVDRVPLSLFGTVQPWRGEDRDNQSEKAVQLPAFRLNIEGRFVQHFWLLS